MRGRHELVTRLKVRQHRRCIGLWARGSYAGVRRRSHRRRCIRRRGFVVVVVVTAAAVFGGKVQLLELHIA